MKICRSCNKEKKIFKFVKLTSSEDGYTNICKKCHREAQKRYRENNPNAYKSINLKSKYGITLSDLEEMKDKQQNKCLVCDTKTEDLVVDHCHTSFKVRGLLCHNCNKALGFFKDDTDNMYQAIKYIVRNN